MLPTTVTDWIGVVVKICKGCNEVIPEFGEFPGGICVDCYSVTAEANRPITARELSQMWGGK